MYDEKCTEMELLDSNLTKDSSLLFHAIHSLSTGGFFRKPISILVLKYIQKKFAKQENSSLFMNSILQNGKMRVEKSSLRRIEFMPRNLDKKCRSRIPSRKYRRSELLLQKDQKNVKKCQNDGEIFQ
jgi:hypothetical protein